jgi:hypothetical protein
MNDSPKHKRRWCRFSLLTLMVVVTLFTVMVGCFVGWVQYRRQRAQENRDGVAAVEEAVEEAHELGGWIDLDTGPSYRERRARSWLELQFDDPASGSDPFTRRPSVGLYGTETSDARLERLIGLEYLRRVEISALYVAKTNVSDVGLKHLREMTGLRLLNLGSTKVTDAGLEHLKGLKSLQYLNLKGTKVTDAGLEHLKGLRRLWALNLGGTNVTDAGLLHLKGLTELSSLSLEGTKITNSGLEHLKGLADLWSLDLDGTKVTNAGLEHLGGLKRLKHLDLENTNVTAEGVKKLQRALPNCEIIR